MTVAENELHELEDKKRQRAEKDKKKEVDQLSKMMRTDARNQGDNQGCAKLLCFWGILNALLWALPLLGDSWWNKTWQGMGVEKLEIGIGLFNLEINLQCKKDILNAERICKSIEKYSKHDGGHWTTEEIAEEMCKAYKGGCPLMNRLYYAGWVPLVTFPGATVFELCSSLLLYFYWHGKPTALVRNLATKCAVMAGIFGVVGFCGWLICSPYLQELPRLWAAEGGNKEFANNSLVGLKEAFMFPCGWCSCVAFIAFFSSFIRFFCQFTLPLHINEPDPFGNDESSRLVQDAERLYDGDKPHHR